MAKNISGASGCDGGKEFGRRYIISTLVLGLHWDAAKTRETGTRMEQ